jgi:C-terminal processing protease CtpA/Prc
MPVAEGALVLTVSKYVSPKGTEIHGKGLEPKVAVDVREDTDEDATSGPDEILLKGIEVLKSEAKRAADATPTAPPFTRGTIAARA